MKLRDLDKYTKLSIAIIAIGIIIRFYLASIHHVAGDGCWQLSNSRFIAENFRLPLFENFGRDEPFWAPPLFHIIVAFVYAISGNFGVNAAESAVKLVSPFFGSSALVLAFLIAKKLYNSKIAFYSAIFLAFIPLGLDYSVFSYVDGTLAFFAVLSVYLALNGRVIGSSVAAGLTILTKYNGIFILPVLLFIIYSSHKNDKSRHEFYKKSLMILIIPAVIGSAWFVRNWAYLGNPVWPFMNNVFNGYDATSFSSSGVGSVDLSRIFSINSIALAYLGIFGVPNSSISAFYFFDIPHLKSLVAIWISGTLIFMMPLFFGIAGKLKSRQLLSVWIGSYFILVLLYVVNAGWSIIRFMLPAFPAIAMIWANGMARISSWRIGKRFTAMVLIISVGLVATSFIKISLAAEEWNIYNDDFEWVKANTNENAVVMSGSQCISYNIDRQTVAPDAPNLKNSDYVFVNQNFRLDRRSIISNDLLREIKSKGTIVYSNSKTGTEVFSVE